MVMPFVFLSENGPFLFVYGLVNKNKNCGLYMVTINDIMACDKAIYLYIYIYIHMNCMVQCYTSDIVGNPSTGEIINQIICYKHSWGFARIFW